MRRVAFGLAAVVVGFAGTLGVEVTLARGGETLLGYDLDRIGGHFGVGNEPPLRVAWIGDSTGSGVGATSLERVLPRMVAEGLGRPVEMSVFAVAGARVSDVIVHQVPRLSEIRPDWVVVAIGGNDVVHLTPRGRFRAELALLLTSIKAFDPSRVVVLGIGEFGSTALFAQPLRFLVGVRGHQLDEDVRNAAARHGALYVDIVGIAGPEFVKDPMRYHARDRFHPSDDGYRLWAEATLKTVARAGW